MELISIVKGRLVELDDKRSVFVGSLEGDPDVYLKLMNDGKETCLKLSPDAAQVLGGMLSFPLGGKAASVAWKKRPTLDDMLAKCDLTAPLPEDREWLDAPPVGREIL